MVSSNPAKPRSKKPAPSTEPKQSFESTFLDYQRAVYRAYTDAQKRGSDVYQAYLREAGENHTELQKRAEDIQREYVAGIQEAFGHEDATVRAEKAYDDAVSAYKGLVEEVQRQGEQVMTKKLVTLLNQQGEDLQKQFAVALTTYLRGLQSTIKQLDCTNVQLSDLEYLSQSIGTVALYASATGAVPK